PAELLPGGQKRSVLVEHDYPAVATVRDVEVVLAVEGDRMRRAQLPVAPAIAGEGLYEFSVLGEHHDTRVVWSCFAVPFADVDVAGGRDGYPGRRVEHVEAALAGALARLAEFQEHAAVGRQFCHLHAFAVFRRGVGYPEIAVLIDRRLMRLDEQTGAEILQCRAVRAKRDDRDAAVCLTTVHGPK